MTPRWLPLLAGLLACQDPATEDEAARCVPGLQIACPCPGGPESVQICNEDGTFGACACGDAGPPPGDAAVPIALPPGCTRLGAGPLRFGAVLPLTGALGEYGPAMVRGLELATAALDPLAIAVCDSGSDPGTAADAITACAHAGLPAVIGPAASFVAVDAFEAAARPTGTLLMSPSATAPALTALADDDLFWRTAPSDARQAEALGRLASGPVVLVHRGDPYGSGLAEAFEAAFCAEGCPPGRLVRAPFFDDPAEAAPALAMEGAEAVVLLVFPGDLPPLLAALQGTPRLLLPDALRTAEVGRSLSRARRAQVLGVMPAQPAGPAWEAFAAAHQARYGEAPGLFAAHAWDAAHALALAGGEGGADVAAALRAGAARAHPSAAGVRLFDARGDAVGAIQAWGFAADGGIEAGPVVLDLDDRLTPP